MRTDGAAPIRQVLPLRAGPRFIEHEELRGRWAQHRLFAQATGGDSPGWKDDLLRFKRMHFCARRLNALRRRYGEAAVTRPDWQSFASRYRELRNEIAANNLALVYYLFGRTGIPDADGDELLSAGMLALTRAIDAFDPWRGIHFGTYACNAIVRAFWRCRRQEAKRRLREPGRLDAHAERTRPADTRRDEERALWCERLSAILTEDRGGLTPIEKHVLRQRLPRDGDAPPRTLTDLGREVGLSKERVRQIETSAIRKLRSALEADPVLR